MTDHAFRTDTRSASEHLALAAESTQRAYDSFDRCDTDGFLSQWASNLTANLHRRQAEIALAGGKAIMVGLWQGDRRVRARVIEGQFGPQWLLDAPEAEQFGRRYLPYGDNSRVQKKLGLEQRDELVDAYAVVEGRGRGLSGSAWVATARKNKWGEDAVLAPIGPDFPIIKL